jgi:hypothetical protein
MVMGEPTTTRDRSLPVIVIIFADASPALIPLSETS